MATTYSSANSHNTFADIAFSLDKYFTLKSLFRWSGKTDATKAHAIAVLGDDRREPRSERLGRAVPLWSGGGGPDEVLRKSQMARLTDCISCNDQIERCGAVVLLPPAAGFAGRHAILAIILDISAASKALSVCVLTLPSDAIDRASAVTAMSSSASTIATTSCWPSVHKSV